MNEHQTATIPKWFWAIAIVSLLWNIMGFGVFLSDVFAQETMIESMTPEQQDWARSTPRWVYFIFAVAVSAGVVGSIGLLLRKSWCVALFAISCVAVLIQMIYTMLIAGGLQVMGPSGAVMPAMVITFSIVWLVFSLFSNGKGWLAS